VAGCATPTGSAGHASATANLKLTFHLDHSAGADHEIIQALVEAKTNVSFDHAVHDLVFRRAHMNDSAFTQPLEAALTERAARGH
jgi:hypothetical protein